MRRIRNSFLNVARLTESPEPSRERIGELRTKSANLPVARGCERRVALPMAMAAEIGEPVLVEMRKVNGGAVRILQAAEAAEDHSTALAAIRECRRNLELIAKLTGELDPRAPGEVSNGALQVTVVYADKTAVQVVRQKRP